MSSQWRGVADLVVEPDVAGFAYDDFKRADDLIRAGEVAMRNALPTVRQWLETPVGEFSAEKTRPAVLPVGPAPMSAD
jgi:hypothetical protein